MRYIVLLFVFVLFSSNSQPDTECELYSYMSIYPEMEIKIETIDGMDFYRNERLKDSILKFKTVPNSDSLELKLIEKHEFILKSNDTLSFNCKNGVFKVWTRIIDDSKGNRTYKLMEYYQNRYLLIKVMGYEYIAGTLIDIENQIGFSLPSRSIVQAEKYIYSGSEEYGDFYISVHSTDGNFILGLDFEYTRISSFFIKDDYLYFNVAAPCGNWELKGFYRVNLLNCLQQRV